MTATNVILGTSSSTTSTLMEKIADASFYLKSSSVLPDGGRSEYAVTTATPGFPLTLTIQNRLVAGKLPQRRISMSIATKTERSSSLNDDVVRAPVEAFIGFNIPVDGTLDVADLDVLLANAYMTLVASVTSGARDTARLTRLINGSSQL